MENAIMSCPKDFSELRPDDQEVFQRVWRRVMPEEREGAPIEVEPALIGGDLPCAVVCPVVKQPAESPEGPGSALCSAAPCPHRGSDFPAPADVTRLGPGSAGHGALLQRQTVDALEAWQLYRCLSRRSAGRGGRMLSTMAAEEYHAARRLAAAYFLISGVRYWPAAGLSAPRVDSYFGAIRRAYQSEQRREQAYLLSAGDTRDEALQELFQDLSVQSGTHSQLLRSLLEQEPL